MPTDKEGNNWELEEAIIRVLVESYPNFISINYISSIFKIHPKFITKIINGLGEANVLQQKLNTFKLKRNWPASQKVNPIFIKAGEAEWRDGICHIITPRLKDLFIDNHNSLYLDWPPIK